MKIFLFILKSVGLSLVGAFVVGLTWGLIKEAGTASHPHQIMPTFLVYLMFMLMVDFFVSIVTSVAMAFFRVMVVKYAAIISVVLSFIGLWIYLSL